MSDDFISFDGFEAQITELITAMNNAENAVDANSEQAAMEAAEIIQDEQKRLLAKANFEKQTTDLSGLIKIRRDEKSKVYKLKVGYDTEAIKEHPEVLVIEFGRPGTSARRSKLTDKLGRKKGLFPRQISHIRAGYFLAKDKAIKHFNEKLYDIAKSNFEE